jgi:hypothetical protein
MLFDFGCCSLAQEMIFVDHHMPYFRQHLITHPLSACLPFQCLFTVSLQGDQLLVPPPFSAALRALQPLCCMFFFSSLFIIQIFLLFFSQASVSLSRGYAGLSQGWLWEYCVPLICLPVGLLDVFQAGLVPTSGGTGVLLFS